MDGHRPAGVTALGIFFAAGAIVSFAAAASLLLPDGPLSSMWRANPRAQAAFAAMGGWAVVLMAVVSAACAAAASGLWRGARWGHRLALALLAINLVGDGLNGLLGGDRRALIGLPIAGALIAYLMTGRVRRFAAGK